MMNLQWCFLSLLFVTCLADSSGFLKCDEQSEQGAFYKLIGTQYGLTRNDLPSNIRNTNLNSADGKYIKLSFQVEINSFDTRGCNIDPLEWSVVGDTVQANTQWNSCDQDKKGSCSVLNDILDFEFNVDTPRWRITGAADSNLPPFPFDTMVYTRHKTQESVYDDDEDGLMSCYRKHISGGTFKECNCDDNSLHNCHPDCYISSLCGPNDDNKVQSSSVHTYTAEPTIDKSCGPDPSSYLSCNQKSNSYGTDARSLNPNNFAYVNVTSSATEPLTPTSFYSSFINDNYPQIQFGIKNITSPCKISQGECRMDFLAGKFPLNGGVSDNQVVQEMSSWSNKCSVSWPGGQTQYVPNNSIFNKNLWFMNPLIYDRFAMYTSVPSRWSKPWSSGTSATSQGFRYTAVTCAYCHTTDSSCDKSGSSLYALRLFPFNIAPTCQGFVTNNAASITKMLSGSTIVVNKKGKTGTNLSFTIPSDQTISPNSGILATSSNQALGAAIINYKVDNTITNQISSNLADFHGFVACGTSLSQSFKLGPTASKFPYLDHYRWNARKCIGCTPLQMPVNNRTDLAQLFYTFNLNQYTQMVNDKCDGSANNPGSLLTTVKEPSWGGFSNQGSVTPDFANATLLNVCNDRSYSMCLPNNKVGNAIWGSPCQTAAAFDQWYTNLQGWFNQTGSTALKPSSPDWNVFQAQNGVPSFYNLNSFPNVWYDLTDSSGKSIIVQPSDDGGLLESTPIISSYDIYLSTDYVKASTIEVLQLSATLATNYKSTNLCLLTSADSPYGNPNLIPPSDQATRCPTDKLPTQNTCAYFTMSLSGTATSGDKDVKATLRIDQSRCNTAGLVLFGNDVTTSSFIYTTGTTLSETIYVTYAISGTVPSVGYKVSACSFDIIQILTTGQELVAATVSLTSCSDTYGFNSVAISAYGGSIYLSPSASSTPVVSPSPKNVVPTATASAYSNNVQFPSNPPPTPSPSPTPLPSIPFSICYINASDPAQVALLNNTVTHHGYYCMTCDLKCSWNCAFKTYGILNEFTTDPCFFLIIIAFVGGIVLLIGLAFAIKFLIECCQRRKARQDVADYNFSSKKNQ